MPGPSILILSPDADAYVRLLEGRLPAGATLAAAVDVREAEACWAAQAVVLGRPDLVAGALPFMAGLRWVQSTWAGVEPLLRAARRDYLLTGVKGVFGPQMAEYVFGHLLAHELRLDERRRRQRAREWWPGRSGTLKGRTLGVMGTGSIGRHIARVGSALGLRVIGYSRSGTAVEGFETVHGAGALGDFLAEPDYLVGVLPGTAATDGLLDAAAFGRMQSHCLLVNVGRGNLVDEAALADALQRGRIAGAVLDVFHREPLPAESPLWDAPGAVVTAHVAAESFPADIARIFERNYHRFVSGDKLEFLVDFERGY